MFIFLLGRASVQRTPVCIRRKRDWAHGSARGASLEDTTRFSQRFDKPAPMRETMRAWEKAFSTGSVLYLKRSGGPASRQHRVDTVEASCSRSLLKSSRKRSSELGIPRSTVQKIIKEDSGLKPFKPVCVNGISDSDLVTPEVTFKALLQRFPN
jgi:hypothetical protein